MILGGVVGRIVAVTVFVGARVRLTHHSISQVILGWLIAATCLVVTFVLSVRGTGLDQAKGEEGGEGDKENRDR